jgi:hypothetical protein
MIRWEGEETGRDRGPCRGGFVTEAVAVGERKVVLRLRLLLAEQADPLRS